MSVRIGWDEVLRLRGLRLPAKLLTLFAVPLLILGINAGLAAAQTYSAPHGIFNESTQFCLVCHEPHQSAGLKLGRYSPESAICFTCHNGTGSNYNIEMEMNRNPATNAMHPIYVNLSNNGGIYSYTPSSTSGIAPPGPYDCSQCHDPHGNTGFVRLLRANYDTSEYVSETSTSYALCWTCHNRTLIVADNDLYFKRHFRHIVDQQSPCTSCHYSPHGVASSELINFNPAYVHPNSRGVGPIFVDEGDHRGSCSLTCHGVDHDNRNY